MLFPVVGLLEFGMGSNCVFRNKVLVVTLVFF